MNSGSVKLLSYILTLYIASTIIFVETPFFNLIHIIDLLLITVFAYVLFIKKEYILNTNSLITVFALFSVFALASSWWGIGFKNPSSKSMQLILILINLFIIYNSMKKFNLYNTFLYGVLLGAFVNYIFILDIISAPFPVIDVEGRRYIGTLGNPNVLALIMVTSILSSIIFLRKEKEISKIFYYYQYINILLATYMIFLTVSKKGIFAGLLLVTVFLLMAIKKPKDFMKLIFFIGAGVIVFLNYIDMEVFYSVADRLILRLTQASSSLSSETRFGSTGERRYLIGLGLDYFTLKPLFGYGLNNFRLIYVKYSHNNYIELLFGVGLVGTVIFYSIYYYLLKEIKKMKDNYLIVIIVTYILILLMIDMALVSYGNRIHIYTLLYIYALAENNIYNREKVT